MHVKIWGSRGSTPVNGAQFSRYSGATACVEVQTATGDIILLDAGSGLCAFERARREAGDKSGEPVICLSHLHLDHIQGLPYYPAIYGGKVKIYGGTAENGLSLQDTLACVFDGVIFPVKWQDLQGVETCGIRAGDSIQIGSARLETAPTNHPGGGLAWKIIADGQTLVYTGDHEIPLNRENEAATRIHEQLLDFMGGADLAIVDSHFSAKDHKRHQGWGHSDFSQWPKELALRGIRRLVLTHFSPDYTDSEIDSLLAESRKLAPDLPIDAAFAGMEIDLEKTARQDAPPECLACDFFQRLSYLSDTHAVLDALLTESRKITGADAGTIYLVEQNELFFAAAQNDTLFPASAANKYAYMNARLTMGKESIAGYTAVTGRILNLSDVYAIDPASPYSFNDSFDKLTGYRTKSVLSVPLVNGKNRVIGVLQLINAKRHGKTTQFDSMAEHKVYKLARMSTIALEKSFLIVSMIIRMLQTSALRDPSETAFHVRRVGSVAAELYHAWAEKRHIDPEVILANKSRLRLAAMLHDVGKVGVPDGVLKKPGRLDDKERAIMQTHSALGAGLFDGEANEIDKMARDIALHHHAKWDGTGYTGAPEISSPSGADIPLWARIVAIADVYDALISKRCYKDAWQPDDALAILQKDAGKHFDPELVDHFIRIQDLVKTIYERYSEQNKVKAAS